MPCSGVSTDGWQFEQRGCSRTFVDSTNSARDRASRDAMVSKAVTSLSASAARGGGAGGGAVLQPTKTPTDRRAKRRMGNTRKSHAQSAPPRELAEICMTDGGKLHSHGRDTAPKYRGERSRDFA